MHKYSTQIKCKFIRTCIDNENRLFSYKDEEYDDSSNLSLHLHSTPIASRLFSNSERI